MELKEIRALVQKQVDRKVQGVFSLGTLTNSEGIFEAYGVNGNNRSFFAIALVDKSGNVFVKK
jgi:hypothetical protein